MKNTLILLTLTIFAIVAFYYVTGCNDKSTTPPSNNNSCKADTTILMTDEFGNQLGGDTTDWCLHDSGSAVFGPAYPNPASIIMRVRFYVPEIDTVKIYILKTCYDTTTYFEGKVNRGQYEIDILDSNSHYKNTYQRIYFKSKLFSSSQFCRFYGDIKFTE